MWTLCRTRGRSSLAFFLVLLGTPRIVDAHSVPTHHKITDAALALLRAHESILVCATSVDLVQVGTGREDDHPSYMFHFSPALDASPWFASCDSLGWGLTKDPTCISTFGPQINTHTWPEARSAADDSGGLGWLHLGYVLHLLQDLTSPAHTRNDPHPPFGDQVDPVEAETRTPVRPPHTQPLLDFDSPEDAFTTLRNYIQENFFSKDTVFHPGLPGPVEEDENDNYFFGPCLEAPPGFVDWTDPACDSQGRRKIAHKGARYFKTKIFFPQKNVRRGADIDLDIAAEQFSELGPIAVLYAASLIRHYYDVASPFFERCPAEPVDFIYATQPHSDTVSVINTVTADVETIPVGDQPLGIALTPDGGRALVTNFLSGTVSVIDTSSNQVVDTVNLSHNPDLANPYVARPTAVAVTPNGKLAYVTTPLAACDDTTQCSRFFDAIVAIISLAPVAGGGALRIPDFPHAVTISPDGRRAYVVSTDGGIVGTVHIIENASFENDEAPFLNGSLPIPAPADRLITDVATSPDGSKVFVSSVGGLFIYDLPLNTGQIVPLSDNEFCTSSNQLTTVAITPDGGRAYVAGCAVVYVVDTVTREVEILRPLTGSDWTDIAISPDGNRAYHARESGIQVLDTTTNSVLRFLRPGMGDLVDFFPRRGGRIAVFSRIPE